MITVSWDVKFCNLIYHYQSFGGIFCLPFQGRKMSSAWKWILSYMDGGPSSYAFSLPPPSALSYFYFIVLILHLVNLFYFVLINFISMFPHLHPPSVYLSPSFIYQNHSFPRRLLSNFFLYCSYLLLFMILFFPFISTPIHPLLPPSFPPPTFPIPFISALCIFVPTQCYCLLLIHPQR